MNIKNPQEKNQGPEATGGEKFRFIRPMLGKDTLEPFNSKKWLFEIKWDGFRTISYIDKGNVNLYSRDRMHYNNTFPSIVKELKKIKGKMILDGEIVLLDNEGCPDYRGLQSYKDNKKNPACYYIFDILYYENKKITHLPLINRKEILRKIINDNDYIKFNDYVIGDGVSFFNLSRRLDLGGLMAKKIDSLYFAGERSSEWLKVKDHVRHLATIIGFTTSGSDKSIDSLLLTFQDNGKYIFAGKVKKGIKPNMIEKIYEQLNPFITNKKPVDTVIKIKDSIIWVLPKIKCEVKYLSMTKKGTMINPLFIRLKK